MSEQDDTISQETTNASKTPVAQSVPDTEVALEARNDGEDDVGPLYARFYHPFLLLVFIAPVAILGSLLWPFRHAVILAAILALLLPPLHKRSVHILRGARLASAALLTIRHLGASQDPGRAAAASWRGH